MVNIHGVDSAQYERNQKMLQEAAQNNESLRLFDDEATQLIDGIRLSLKSWVSVVATGREIDSYADDKPRFQALMRGLVDELEADKMIKLEPDNVVFLLDTQNKLLDRICVAIYHTDLNGVKEMYSKLGDMFGKDGTDEGF